MSFCSLQQQIYLNDNISGNKCYHCNEGSLYSFQFFSGFIIIIIIGFVF